MMRAESNGCFFAEDKLGRNLNLKYYAPEDFNSLCEMYDDFFPKAVAMGLPPACNQARRMWLSGISREWTNLLAFADDRLVGHAALDAMGVSDGREFLIFVHQNFQNQGIGQILTFLMLNEACRQGCRKVWLMVDCFNSIAISVYRKTGFRICGYMEQERMMSVDPLKSSRKMNTSYGESLFLNQSKAFSSS